MPHTSEKLVKNGHFKQARIGLVLQDPLKVAKGKNQVKMTPRLSERHHQCRASELLEHLIPGGYDGNECRIAHKNYRFDTGKGDAEVWYNSDI
eukprot:CAMPEP_0171593376 /NCGR_PEP_ID=MMETSP0990-20121206/75_1 /TAXON_ID=483369 /ORGANISM="non described non described, Strain CCMP2098" /LENGTH=92 /DNA_ID=CAMNT_0012153899 /DNA_START=525 /DNA_END=804 /DNA_ORIENTATION=+